MARQWTGREAAALRHARRMSVRAYAARLGVTVSTVANWDSRGEQARLRTDTQQLLDIDPFFVDQIAANDAEIDRAESDVLGNVVVARVQN